LELQNIAEPKCAFNLFDTPGECRGRGIRRARPSSRGKLDSLRKNALRFGTRLPPWAALVQARDVLV